MLGFTFFTCIEFGWRCKIFQVVLGTIDPQIQQLEVFFQERYAEIQLLQRKKINITNPNLQ